MRRAVLSKEDIINHAIMMVDRGDKLSFSTLARKMKTTSQSLYNYFTNQKALEDAIVQSLVQSITEDARRQLFGVSGEDGIIKMAVIFRKKGLHHIRLAQFIFSHERTDGLNQSINELRELIYQMLRTKFNDKNILIASRLLRSLVVGEILNVGMGWFTSTEVSAEESFITTLNVSLESLQR